MNAKTRHHFWSARAAHGTARLFSANRGGNIRFELAGDSSGMPVYREAIFRFTSVALTLLLLPAALGYFLLQQYPFALTLGALFLPMVLHCWWLFRRNRPLFSPLVLMAVTSAALLATIYYKHYANIFWAPALVMLFHFILSRNAAIVINILFYGLSAPVIVEALPPDQAAILLLSLALLGLGAAVFSQLVARQDQQLQKVAVQDPLTLAYNRRYLMECLDQTFELHKRYHKVSSLIMLDLDHFKSINDDFGHGEGDRALKEVVRLLQQRLRRTDSLFRYGGEEFVILLSETELSQAYQLAQEFCGLIRNATILPERPITVSCGVAELSSGENPLGWLARCDEALYRAKHAGRDRAEQA